MSMSCLFVDSPAPSGTCFTHVLLVSGVRHLLLWQSKPWLIQLRDQIIRTREVVKLFDFCNDWPVATAWKVAIPKG